jgi:riboflavin synthase
MFSGIIKTLGEVRSIDGDGDKRVSLYLPDAPTLNRGDSVACNGVCLTVLSFKNNIMNVDISTETLKRSSLGGWQNGDKVNIEYSLRLGDTMDGHIVSGHVDALGEILAITPSQRSYEVIIKPLNSPLMAMIAEKGSIAVDGVSLTVNAVTRTDFTVMIIPHTWDATLFQFYKVGTLVNLEVDMLARYVARQLAFQEGA